MNFIRRFIVWSAKRKLARAGKLVQDAGFSILVDTPFFFEERMEVWRQADALGIKIELLRREIVALEETIR